MIKQLYKLTKTIEKTNKRLEPSLKDTYTIVYDDVSVLQNPKKQIPIDKLMLLSGGGVPASLLALGSIGVLVDNDLFESYEVIGGVSGGCIVLHYIELCYKYGLVGTKNWYSKYVRNPFYNAFVNGELFHILTRYGYELLTCTESFLSRCINRKNYKIGCFLVFSSPYVQKHKKMMIRDEILIPLLFQLDGINLTFLKFEDLISEDLAELLIADSKSKYIDTVEKINKSVLKINATGVLPIVTQIQNAVRALKMGVVFGNHLPSILKALESEFLVMQIQHASSHLVPRYENIPILETLSIYLNMYLDNAFDPIYDSIRWDLYREKNAYLAFVKNKLKIDIDKYRPSNMSSRAQTMSFEFIDFIVNETFYVFDFMTRKSASLSKYFVLDLTSILQDVEIKPGFMPLQTLSYFTLHETNGFQLYKFVYQNNTYYRDNTKNKKPNNEKFIALYTLYASISQVVTITNHALNDHFNISSRLSNINDLCLSKHNPIRTLLYPFEMNANNIASAAMLTLFVNNGVVNRTFNFTNQGIVQLMNNYYSKYHSEFLNSTSKPLFCKLYLTENELHMYPISTYHRYYKDIFKPFVEEYVDCIYPRKEESIDNDEETKLWVDTITNGYISDDFGGYIDTIKAIIGGWYFALLSHRMLSNDNILYCVFMFPNIVSDGDSYSIFSKFSQMLITVYQTNDIFVPITKNMEFMFEGEDKKLRLIYRKMYKRIMKFEREFGDQQYVLQLRPSLVSSSISS